MGNLEIYIIYILCAILIIITIVMIKYFYEREDEISIVIYLIAAFVILSQAIGDINREKKGKDEKDKVGNERIIQLEEKIEKQDLLIEKLMKMKINEKQ